MPVFDNVGEEGEVVVVPIFWEIECDPFLLEFTIRFQMVSSIKLC
jgi:hypothetical protein